MRPRFRTLLAAATLLIAPSGGLDAAPLAGADLQFFESEVRPVLAENCFRCHSATAEKLKGGLLLDHGSTILAGGEAGTVLVPGDPEKSLLIEAVRYKNPEVQMPPKKRLPDKAIAALEKWVAMGAPWPDEPVPVLGEKKLGPKNFDLAARKAEHWCWQPVKRDAAPAVKNAAWSDDPIDRHILTKLEEKGIAPSAPADKRALIRRAYFDLIGLPPEREKVEAFVADNSPDAFAKVIDELLNSQHFGERWARHWMDSVRYAESCGHEFDYPIPHATEYRDYLIRAFNADVPYDQFAAEHIAGDLIKNPRRHPKDKFNESIIGTGSWFLSEAVHAPTDVREDEAGRVDNQIDVFSKTFLGVTVSCARCHDHMFDAISTKDYYALAGYLQSSRRQEALLDPGERIRASVAKMGEIKKRADSIVAGSIPQKDTPRWVAKHLFAAREVARGTPAEDAAKRNGVTADAAAEWGEAMKSEDLKSPAHPFFLWWKFVEWGGDADPLAFGKRREAVGKELEDARGKSQESDLVHFADFDGKSFDQLGWIPDGFAWGNSPTSAGEWVQSRGDVADASRAHSGRFGGKAQGVLRSPTFEIAHNNIHIRGLAVKGGLQVRLIIDSYTMEPYNGLLFRGTRINDADTKGKIGWLSLGGDLKMYRGHKAHLEFIDHGNGYFDIDGIWFSNGGAPQGVPSKDGERIASNDKIRSLDDLALAFGWLVARREASGELIAWLRKQASKTGEPAAALASVQAELSMIANALPGPKRVQALADGSAENEFVFLRGSHKRLGDEVPRRFLTALGGEDVPPAKVGSGRLDLARQVADAANPLTPRVITNRLWHHLFGRGIVASTDDFGVLGKRPTHPELLDHLAATFVDDGWSIKRALKRLMLTKTYQQASAAGGRGDEVDPENLLLHRANLRRLQGEAIRDSILAISGRLDRKMFGGSVSVHLTAFMTGRGRPQNGPLDGAGRRSLYTTVRRNFLPPMMLAFDTPIPFSSMGTRSVSNVPAQALILMNDPFVHEQAALWAKRLEGEKLAPLDLIHRMYLDAFARPPRAGELEAGFEFLGDKPDHDTLRDYAHVLFNTKEFIFLH